jgi:hypothetical protein
MTGGNRQAVQHTCKMKKNTSVLRLGALPVPRKIEKARSIADAMKENVHFPSPVPPLDVITQLTNEVEAAQLAAIDAGKEETANVRVKVHDLELALKALAAYVEAVANADPANADVIILSAGMDVRKPAARMQEDFAVRSTGKQGEILLHKRFENRAAFIFQMTTTPEQEASWETVHTGTQGRFTVKGLPSATRYYFRVAVVNKNGQRPWSAVKSAVAI